MDCGFIKDEKWFRLRACAVILWEDKLLMAHNEKDQYYYSVGGGIHHNEDSKTAVIREVFEETGLQLEIDRLVYIHENFFVDPLVVDGRFCHEVSFYFLMKYDGQSVRSGSVTMEGFKEEVVWLDLDCYEAYPAFPKFLKDLKYEIPDTVQHIIDYEAESERA